MSVAVFLFRPLRFNELNLKVKTNNLLYVAVQNIYKINVVTQPGAVLFVVLSKVKTKKIKT